MIRNRRQIFLSDDQILSSRPDSAIERRTSGKRSDRVAMNILFVCSYNKWRSTTAEKIWRNAPGVNVRSAGTAAGAHRTVSEADIVWADLILVMEDKHASRIKSRFRQLGRHMNIHVLDIPNDYQFMDTDLVEILEMKVAPFIEDS
ncbi:MAG TPA: phosphotyrosine protein phosphatase [Afifellaceae bacterium]|nr:phosphotyrosine protein phosphatase [Afifellaceae bacterium]